tara:strand:- start:2337 stop:2615 length:279 start_codon:yes stop_codon:yes gene_type:complete
MYSNFFKGEVRFISQGFFNTKYSLVNGGSIIKVKNSTHIREILDQSNGWPDKFSIIAPIEVVKIVSGYIPESYIHNIHINEYLRLRKQYHGV